MEKRFEKSAGKKFLIRKFFLLPIALMTLGLLISCSEDEAPIENEVLPELPTTPYGIQGGNLLFEGQPTSLKGVNALQTFGLDNSNLMNEWKVDIVREFIGNLREQPVDGFAIQASDGAWYHPLQAIVDQHRANGRVTILCPFGWVDENGNQQLFTGLNPRQQDFYEAYSTRMRAIAEHFAGQQDVWLEVWNEPYHWNNENSYTHSRWLADMQDMVDNLRSVQGFTNIIVVPGNEQGQSEDVLIEEGQNLMEGRYNLLFDLHAYEKWLGDDNANTIVRRVNNLQEASLPFIFGEIGVVNVGDLMEVDTFLDVMDHQNIPTLAWLWNRNSEDRNALLSDDGLPNDSNNLNWGSTYQAFLKD